ncbi:glycerol-3-phosphate acyltransferase [Carboxydothermus hydrogenoformans]|uniref:Putative membrane protein n=1 Tax=Carboxydothermus hydrogenoformans (strain ATCC BAA-161 / DSM 6008 / Z-2901) TaxID=246194 RepID=Q3AD44_CARHZ|nr:glycerol-3-phosphate acyltransferase [Carboxydothermus hydrogenoformans]ABB14928.1 putative membrane protein [Carboxydothermus hydrogenoformans Z-2901]
MILLLMVIEFTCGSLMFSYWLGVMVGKKLEDVRDGNPGAFNLWYAAGFKVGILGAILDFLKGYFPLVYFIKKEYLINGIALIFVAIAPVLGHAFSPFLRFKGGKAMAVTFGVWSAVTDFKASFFYAVVLGILKALERIYFWGSPSLPERDAMLDIVGFTILMFFLIGNGFEKLLLLWVFNFLVLLYKRRRDFKILLKKRGNFLFK